MVAEGGTAKNVFLAVEGWIRYGVELNAWKEQQAGREVVVNVKILERERVYCSLAMRKE